MTQDPFAHWATGLRVNDPRRNGDGDGEVFAFRGYLDAKESLVVSMVHEAQNLGGMSGAQSIADLATSVPHEEWEDTAAGWSLVFHDRHPEHCDWCQWGFDPGNTVSVCHDCTVSGGEGTDYVIDAPERDAYRRGRCEMCGERGLVNRTTARPA